jgi:hypothetical protein
MVRVMVTFGHVVYILVFVQIGVSEVIAHFPFVSFDKRPRF